VVDGEWLRMMLRELDGINTRPTRSERIKLRCQFYASVIVTCAVSGALLFALVAVVGTTHWPKNVVFATATILYYLVLYGIFAVLIWYTSRRK